MRSSLWPPYAEWMQLSKRGGPETKEKAKAGPVERWCLEDQDGGRRMDLPWVWETG